MPRSRRATAGSILDAAASAAEPDETEADFVAELLDRAGPQRIAAAFLRQQLAAHPVPEELWPLPAEALQDRRSARDRGSARDGAPVREPRPDMQGGVWFTISLGRRQRADPKFLLPMICNAGGVTKRDVGAIRIDDTETRFEISADKAAAFAERIRQPESLERGIIIAPAGEAGGKPGQAKAEIQGRRQAGPQAQGPAAGSRSKAETQGAQAEAARLIKRKTPEIVLRAAH